MKRLFISNLGFETEWQHGTVAQRIREFESQMSCVWAPIWAEQDVLLAASPIDADYWERLAEHGIPKPEVISNLEVDLSGIDEVVPWGWTNSVADLSKRICPKQRVPSLNAVRMVNSRDYAVVLEREFGVSIGTKVCSTIEQVVQCLRDFETGGVVKPLLSQAGRGQLRISSNPEIPAKTCERLLKSSPVVVEPWLHSLAEYGCQWEIDESGEVCMLGVTQLTSNTDGSFHGSRTGTPKTIHHVKEILSIQEQAVRRIAEEDYFGPVGIDAMVFRDANGQERVRSLQDINARFTMGRIAIEWSRTLGEQGLWIQARRDEEIPANAWPTSPSQAPLTCWIPE